MVIKGDSFTFRQPTIISHPTSSHTSANPNILQVVTFWVYHSSPTSVAKYVMIISYQSPQLFITSRIVLCITWIAVTPREPFLKEHLQILDLNAHFPQTLSITLQWKQQMNSINHLVGGLLPQGTALRQDFMLENGSSETHHVKKKICKQGLVTRVSTPLIAAPIRTTISISKLQLKLLLSHLPTHLKNIITKQYRISAR